jgi:hypothetical protein
MFVLLSWADIRLGRERGWRGVTGLESLGILEPLSDGTLPEGAEPSEGAVLAVVLELNRALLHTGHRSQLNRALLHTGHN